MPKLFFSYSHKDESLRDQLGTHLSLLQRQGHIEPWHDRKIIAGSQFDDDISEAMEAADIILLLVSANFMASDYCYSQELKRAMNRHEAGLARVIPVILKDCDWHSAPFGKLKAVPTDGKAVTLWQDADQAFANVAREVRRAVDAVGARISANSPQAPHSAAPLSVRAAPTTPARPVAGLKLRKEFTDFDRDEFLVEAYAAIVERFESFVHALKLDNPDVQGRIERIDARRFAVSLYRGGKPLGSCSIRLERMHRSSGIAYSGDSSAASGSYNDMLHVETDDQELFLKPMMASFSRSALGERLSQEMAADYLWEKLTSQFMN